MDIMRIHPEIIDTLSTFAHRTDVECADKAVQAFRPFGSGAVAALAYAMSNHDDHVRFHSCLIERSLLRKALPKGEQKLQWSF